MSELDFQRLSKNKNFELKPLNAEAANNDYFKN